MEIPQRQWASHERHWRRWWTRRWGSRRWGTELFQSHSRDVPAGRIDVDSRGKSYQAPRADVEEVKNEEDDVDDDKDKVESRAVAESTLSEARTTTIPEGKSWNFTKKGVLPLGTEKRANDESADDLENLDDSAVGGKEASVQSNVAHGSERKSFMKINDNWKIREKGF